jgi:F-type H+-transporting ATPase subunit gamma
VYDSITWSNSPFSKPLRAIQRPELVQLLPIVPPPDRESAGDYLYEPDADTVLDELLPRYVEMVVYQAVLEAIGSEQSARMVAMRNASDNAKDIINALTLEYNKARQQSITGELLDIIGGVAAVEG